MSARAQENPWHDNGRKWIFGKDISSWPQQKLARAIKHRFDFEAQFAQWALGFPLTSERVISDDRLTWQTKLKVFSPPPVAGLSLAFGDCVHALRSALDAGVWEFAHMDAGNPKQPRNLQFPILRKQSQWAKARVEQLQTVPDDVADRIERMQPFNRAANEMDRDALLCMSHLDNVDKHRSSIRVKLVCDTINMNMTVRWEDPTARERNLPPRVVAHTPDIVDGAVIMEFSSLDPIAEVVGGAGAGFRLQVDTPTGYQDPFQLLSGLINYIQNLLAGLTGGLEKVEETPISDDSTEGWIPMDIQQEGGTFRFVPPSV